MAHNDTPDQEIERLLREHFTNEGEDLRAPQNTWQRLKSRLDEEPIRRRFRNWLFPQAGPPGWGPSFAVAAVVVVAAVTTVTIWTLSGGGNDPIVPLSSTINRESDPPPFVSATATPIADHGPTQEPMDTFVLEDPGPQTVADETETAAPVISAREPMPTRHLAMSPTPTPRPRPPEPTAVPGDASLTWSAAPEGNPGPQGPPGAEGPRGGRGEEPSPAEAPYATTFRDYGQQPFTSTSEDAVSTFSLDTDRTSYRLALSWARAGYEVAPESVRAEEWINSLDYGYSPPSDDWGFAISSDVFRHPLDPGKHMVRIAFQAPDVPDDTPLNVTLVLDASGSMSHGNRVAIARQAAETIRQSLRPRDRLAVVHFTDDVIHDFTVEHRDPDDSSVRDSIDRLAPHDSTNVQAGLNLGVRLADNARRSRPDAYNYIVLMSDGVANVDATDPFAILESSHDENAGNPLRIITIGVGVENYNDYLLEQLAQHGNGWYRYLDDTDQARMTFARENWLSISTPFADQTRAQVTWDTNLVRSWRIVGYENRVTPDETFTEDRKEFAEIPSGTATTVFYELELHGQALRRGGPVHLGNVELRWVVPDSRQSRGQRAEVQGRLNSDFSTQDPWLQLGTIVGLSADRYSGLTHTGGEYYSDIHDELMSLLHQLRSLQPRLGQLEAYQDFQFLLGQMAGTVRDSVPPPTPSGYSR